MKFGGKCPHCNKEIEVTIWMESRDTDHPEPKRREFDGYVYLVYSPTNNTYKIGRAKQVDSRYGSIAKQSPVEVKLIHSFKSSDSKKAERTLHQQYNHLRVLGEWFSLSEADVQSIISIGDYGL